MTRNAWIRSLWRDAYARVRIAKGCPIGAFGIFGPSLHVAFLDCRERAALAAYHATHATVR